MQLARNGLITDSKICYVRFKFHLPIIQTPPHNNFLQLFGCPTTWKVFHTAFPPCWNIDHSTPALSIAMKVPYSGIRTMLLIDQHPTLRTASSNTSDCCLPICLWKLPLEFSTTSVAQFLLCLEDSKLLRFESTKMQPSSRC